MNKHLCDSQIYFKIYQKDFQKSLQIRENKIHEEKTKNSNSNKTSFHESSMSLNKGKLPKRNLNSNQNKFLNHCTTR